MSAKNKEAQSGINRFLALKNREAGVLETNPNLRPKYVQKEQSLPQADKWRSVVLGEISTRLSKINDPAANDYQVRDLNDELNKLYKEKRAWEYHIRDLGGQDYILSSQSDGLTGVEVNGYRYFGRAKDLPDIKKILEDRRQSKKTQGDKKLQKQLEEKRVRARNARLDEEYFGYEELAEEDSEKRVKNQVLNILGISILDDRSPPVTEKNGNDILNYERTRSVQLIRKQKEPIENQEDDIIDDDIPSNDDVMKWFVQRRKKQLLAKLAST